MSADVRTEPIAHERQIEASPETWQIMLGRLASAVAQS